MTAPLKQSALAGRLLAGSGLVIAIAFFLPMVRGCGAEVSAFRATEVNPLFWLYPLAGLALMGIGLTLHRHARRGLLAAASGTAGLPFGHLLFKSAREILDGGELEPLIGYWLLLFSLGFATFLPLWAWRPLGRQIRGTTATAGGGRVRFEAEDDDDARPVQPSG